MNNWEYVLKLYEACDSNKDFLNTYYNNANRVLNLDNSLIEEKIINGISKKNKDILIKSDKEELIKKYKNNQLVTCRMGCVETSFLLNYYFNKKVLNDHMGDYKDKYDDKYLKKLGGMYYVDEKDKLRVQEWWCNNTIELLKSESVTLTSCYLVLAYDLLLFSVLDLKNKTLSSWSELLSLISLFEQQKILVISNGINSMKHAYDLGLQKMYNIRLPEFSVDFCFTPQTTEGMLTTDSNMIETTDKIINKIETEHNNFTTALLACGAYTPPLINILSKKFPNKNILYMGSSLYTMFGLYSDGIDRPMHMNNFYCLDNFIRIPEKCPDACKHIDGGKYWG